MHQCPTCGKQLDDGVRFCPDDGTPLTDTAASSGQRTPTFVRPPTRELELPVVVGNRYKLVESRGGGGMATVYRALDVTLEREVAVKLINPDLRNEAEFDARFHREARIASQLSDPHIVVVHDFGIDAALGPYLVMEYLKGQSLRERLVDQGPLPLKAGLQLSAQLVLALIHAHEKSIVHRDIKPDNIFLLNQSGVRLHVRVLDFGIARIYRHDEVRSETLTKLGGVVGTPRYMSPEQLAGQPVDARSDLYSAALVIHEALTGQLPYVSGKKLTELCPDATPALQELLDHCLKPNPNERPASAVEVYLRLQELGKASGILLLPPGAMEKLVASRRAQQQQASTIDYVPDARPPVWRRPTVLAVSVAVLLLLAVSAYALMHYLRKDPPVKLPERESLLGLRVGSNRGEVVGALGEPAASSHGDPFTKPPSPSLGHVLLPEDVGADHLADTDMLVWASRKVCVILQAGQVRAVVAHEPRAANAAGVRVGDPESRLIHLYSDAVPEIHRAPAGGKVYRYDELGIGFEVENEKVTGITLYAAAAP